MGTVVAEGEIEITEYSANRVEVRSQSVGKISSDLRAGADVAGTIKLQANKELSTKGMMLSGQGFVLEQEQLKQIGYSALNIPKVIRMYRTGCDLVRLAQEHFVIDLFGLTEEQASLQYPNIYHWILDRVKPERKINNRKAYRDNWWIFAEPRAKIRPALQNINRYIATPRTAKHRFFTFLPVDVISESEVVMIALDDAYFLGVLSSHAHITWTRVAGGTLGSGPRYNNSVCFDPFPFPNPTPKQKQKIRNLGERLDVHRKQVQAQHPDVTITGMYNLLEKLRAGEPFTDKDREYNDKALVSTLKQIHDELDTAVLDAYGWHHDISDEEILERLVALNAERAEEERNGLIRWLRPEYQAPDEVGRQQVIAGVIEPEEVAVAPAAQKTLPKKPKDQLAAIRDLLLTSGGEWTVEQVAAQFNSAQRQKKAIFENLERLEWFGILISREEGGVTRWQFAQMQQVA